MTRGGSRRLCLTPGGDGVPCPEPSDFRSGTVFAVSAREAPRADVFVCAQICVTLIWFLLCLRSDLFFYTGQRKFQRLIQDISIRVDLPARFLFTILTDQDHLFLVHPLTMPNCCL
nr:MAG TPA: hypothetical protein [Caudoviricetes sp.]